MSEFKGEVSVKSTPAGFAVSFIGETDAHDLGHALAAIVCTYLNVLQDVDRDEMVEIIVDGIHCGIENNIAASSQSGEVLH